MGHVSSSEADVAFALAVSLAALASSFLLLAAIALMRGARRWRAWRLASEGARWRDALHMAIEDPAAATLPPIAAIDLPEFAVHWNHLQASVKGAASQNLARLLRAQGLDRRLLRLLERRQLRLKLIAITALGYLHEEGAWDLLLRLAREPSPVLSFAAAQALLRIAPAAALNLLAVDIVGREDWSLARLGAVFQELGPDVVTVPLANAIAARPRRGLERAVKLARFGHRRRIAPVVREWLGASDDPGVLAAGLDYAEGEEDLKLVRGAARHGDWRVRMAAARALGRVGDLRDLATLLALLRDPRWWVRYHAAQSLTRLHGLDPTALDELRAGARDPFAADMLGQALADRGREP